MDESTSKLPPKAIKPSRWPHIDHLQLLDPDIMNPKNIDCILGAQAYARIALPDNIPGLPDEPCAQSTRLGWILIGASVVESLDYVEDCFLSTFFLQSDTDISNALVEQ